MIVSALRKGEALMLKSSKTLTIAAGALVAFGLAMLAPEAQARPQHLKQFVTKYPALIDAAKAKKCAICHDPADKKKKTRNQYGKAVGEGLEKENQKDKEVIDKALGKAEAVKSEKTGKTFGEMIKDGKLPE
jgi:hypothetical protein